MARFRLLRRSATQTEKIPKLLVHRAIHRVRRKTVEQMLMPCDTMRAVLEKLRAEGVTMAVVSNGLGRGYGHDVLKTFGLDKYFSAAVFREDVARGKPWPDSILAALGSLGRDLRRSDVIWYVGDQRKDVTAALAASQAAGRSIRPMALGARAALAAVEARLSPSQILWTAGDLERTIEVAFEEERARFMIDPLPAPLL